MYVHAMHKRNNLQRRGTNSCLTGGLRMQDNEWTSEVQDFFFNITIWQMLDSHVRYNRHQAMWQEIAPWFLRSSDLLMTASEMLHRLKHVYLKTQSEPETLMCSHWNIYFIQDNLQILTCCCRVFCFHCIGMVEEFSGANIRKPWPIKSKTTSSK